MGTLDHCSLAPTPMKRITNTERKINPLFSQKGRKIYPANFKSEFLESRSSCFFSKIQFISVAKTIRLVSISPPPLFVGVSPFGCESRETKQSQLSLCVSSSSSADFFLRLCVFISVASLQTKTRYSSSFFVVLLRE